MTDVLNREIVLDALRRWRIPKIRKSLVELNMIQDVRWIRRVSFKIVLTTPLPAETCIEEDCGPRSAPCPGQGRPDRIRGERQGCAYSARTPTDPGSEEHYRGGSGKGGVGKSTVSVNLARALAKSGAKAGLLDADIYGPNIPMMLGIMDEQPEAIGETILPIVKHDLKIMSIGLLVPPEKALIWRGPMLHGVLMQFFQQVEWEPLDYLVIDLPPGTGDAQLTMTQTLAVSGAVIVTTPQEVALADVRKGINMFQEVKVPILGSSKT
jgi:ATP-binding protein involved in chromosome partitioning